VYGCGYDFDLTCHIGFRDLPPQIQRLYGHRQDKQADSADGEGVDGQRGN
jgi:hypothetical protein